MSRSQNLYQLQQIDSQIDQMSARLAEIEQLLAENTNLRKAAALAQKAQEHFKAAQKSQAQAEQKVSEQRIKIEQSEATLYGGSIHNPKELQNLQKEVAALKRFLETLEERQIETMLTTDEAQQKNQEAQKILHKYRLQAERQQASLKGERAHLRQQTAQLHAQREAALPAIAAEDIALYERVRQQRSGVAVARVKDQACGACGATLTAALHQAARSPSQIVFCDSCGRILHAA